ncbi:MAG: halocyanin domain-containing protein [Haloarculaceae archaeon]
MDRRTVLGTTAAVLAGSALAGCTGGEQSDTPATDGGSGGGGSGDGGSTDGGSTDGGSTDGSGGGSGDDGGSAREFDGWMEGVSNYDGVVDETGSDQVTVSVGAQGNGGAFAFDPPAVSVSTGTTVVWKWTGEGGTHNVVAEDGDFESEMADSAGHTFEHTFGSAGTYKYHCQPHSSLGMKGVVVE